MGGFTLQILEVVIVMDDKLNERQRKFAEFYVQNGNAAESAKKAGYSEKFAAQNANKLLKNTNVSKYIKQLSDKIEDKCILNAKDRQIILSEIAKDDMNEPSDRIKSIDVLNKMSGEYLQKVDITNRIETEKNKLDAIMKQVFNDE